MSDTEAWRALAKEWDINPEQTEQLLNDLFPQLDQNILDVIEKAKSTDQHAESSLKKFLDKIRSISHKKDIRDLSEASISDLIGLILPGVSTSLFVLKKINSQFGKTLIIHAYKKGKLKNISPQQILLQQKIIIQIEKLLEQQPELIKAYYKKDNNLKMADDIAVYLAITDPQLLYERLDQLWDILDSFQNNPTLISAGIDIMSRCVVLLFQGTWQRVQQQYQLGVKTTFGVEVVAAQLQDRNTQLVLHPRIAADSIGQNAIDLDMLLETGAEVEPQIDELEKQLYKKTFPDQAMPNIMDKEIKDSLKRRLQRLQAKPRLIAPYLFGSEDKKHNILNNPEALKALQNQGWDFLQLLRYKVPEQMREFNEVLEQDFRDLVYSFLKDL